MGKFAVTGKLSVTGFSVSGKFIVMKGDFCTNRVVKTNR